MSNFAGSFFHGIPASASLGRSSIQYSVRSQCASIVGCIVLLILLTTIGKYVAVMPKALLASIILVNMMLVVFRQVGKAINYWKESKKEELFVWSVACICIIAFGLVLGFIIALGFYFIFSTVKFIYFKFINNSNQNEIDEQSPNRLATLPTIGIFNPFR